MSEPVGNSPRGQIPGNSHKQRAERQPEPEVTREKVDAIIEGGATVRKKSWWQRAGKTIIVEDANAVGQFMLMDLAIPAFKNMIRDVLVGGVERGLYGTSRSRGTHPSSVLGSRDGSSMRVRYDSIPEEGRPRVLSREARARHSFEDIVLESHQECVRVLEAMYERIDRFKVATVTDLYDFCNVTGSWADQNYGWTSLRDAGIRQVRGGFLLDLPAPQPIR